MIYVNTLLFFLLIIIGCLGWVFACAFGINEVFKIIDKIQKKRNKIDGGF